MQAVAALSITVLATCAHAHGVSAQALGSAQAEVVRPLLVKQESDLVFGSIFAGDIPGRVTVTPQGRIVYEGGVASACTAWACSFAQPAAFMISGEPGRSYQVAIPASVAASGNLVGGGGAPQIMVDGLVVETASRPGSGANGQLNGTGEDQFTIGGVLRIPARLAPASYSARIPVIVTYS